MADVWGTTEPSAQDLQQYLATIEAAPKFESLWGKAGAVAAGLGRIWKDRLTAFGQGLAHSVVDAAKLPGDVYAGKVDPKSSEGIDRALNFAGLVPLSAIGSLAAGVRPAANELNLIIGPKALTADRAALVEAQKLDALRIPREVTYDRTGWYRAPDGGWRSIIPDPVQDFALPAEQRAFYGNMPTGLTGRLGDIWLHNDLYRAYPELANVPVRHQDFTNGVRGMVTWENNQPLVLLNSESLYLPNVPPDKAVQAYHRSGDPLVFNKNLGVPSTLAHEVQHLIQDREGWLGQGTNTAWVKDQAERLLAIEAAQGNTRALDMYRHLQTPAGKAKGTEAAFNIYQKEMGESEARLAEELIRGNWNLGRKSGVYPWELYDVPETNQLLLDNGLGR